MPEVLRVTIGGVEVDAPGVTADFQRTRVVRPLSGDSGIPVIAQGRVSGPVTVSAEGWLPSLCPIPPGPWRLAGAVAIAAAIIAILVAVCARPRAR